MIEILGGEGLKNAFTSLSINAKQTYHGDDFEVWEIPDYDFERLCMIPDSDWKESWGWWREGHCSLEGHRTCSYIVNGQEMLGYEPDIDFNNLGDFEIWNEKLTRNYESYIDWLHEIMNLSNLKHIVCFAISLAKENELTLSEFMHKYQPDLRFNGKY